MDFETDAIVPRPHYPPKPVGVALRSERWKKSKYLAWGHPEGNNCTLADARRELKAFAREHQLLCHHAGFDLDVAETHMGLKWPADHEDTLLLGFLVDPDSPSLSLSLKPQAERYLGEPPDEQNALHDWIVANVPGATKKNAGAYICRAPVRLVAPYACGDTDRTLGLYRHFKKLVQEDNRGGEGKFWEAYRREVRVTRTLIRMERRGLPIRAALLGRDIARYAAVSREIEVGLLERLRVPAKLHAAILDDYDSQDAFKWSGPGFAEWLLRSRLVKELPLTEKGNPSTSAESLAQVMPKELAHEFEVRSQIATCLNTFMRPWARQAQETGGLFFARFNQVRNSDEWGKSTGARTGRLSMTPNLQNVIRSDKDERVPKLRDYVGPGPYGALCQRDYSQQELRLLAHFEDGPFLQAYIDDPERDGHLLVKDLIEQTTGIKLERRPVKDLNFGIIYGQGINLTAEKLGVSKEEAKRLQAAHAKSLPGLPDLQRELKERVRANEPIWTWGGRRYFCEPPKVIKGRLRTFDYKMLNKLIQGSAADVTKQAMVNYDSLGAFADEHPMLLQVHDELINGARARAAAREVHRRMRECMADVSGIAVPMMSDGKVGSVSWHQMKKVPKSWER